MRVLVATVGVALTLAAAGCSAAGDTDSASGTATPSPSTTTASQSVSASAAPPTPEQPAGYVNRATWSEGPWPLTVDEAVLECQGDSLVTDAGPLIQRGLALCGASPSPTTSTGVSNRPAGRVERETWNDGPWPFTVDTATLLCTKGAGGERVTVVADGEMYALNGTAKSAKLWPPFDAIWLDNPNIPGLKVNIDPMINCGLALCGG